MLHALAAPPRYVWFSNQIMQPTWVVLDPNSHALGPLPAEAISTQQCDYSFGGAHMCVTLCFVRKQCGVLSHFLQIQKAFSSCAACDQQVAAELEGSNDRGMADAAQGLDKAPQSHPNKEDGEGPIWEFGQ